jgi:hypothetical protein
MGAVRMDPISGRTVPVHKKWQGSLLARDCHFHPSSHMRVSASTIAQALHARYRAALAP